MDVSQKQDTGAILGVIVTILRNQLRNKFPENFLSGVKHMSQNTGRVCFLGSHELHKISLGGLISWQLRNFLPPQNYINRLWANYFRNILTTRFWQNRFFADCFFWVVGFFCGFLAEFLAHSYGKKCPERSSGKIPCKNLQVLYKNPDTFLKRGCS